MTKLLPPRSRTRRFPIRIAAGSPSRKKGAWRNRPRSILVANRNQRVNRTDADTLRFQRLQRSRGERPARVHCDWPSFAASESRRLKGLCQFLADGDRVIRDGHNYDRAAGD